MPARDPALVEPNNEQRDEDQAQDVTADALALGEHALAETERGGESDPAELIPEDTPDLVEKMNDMVASGHLDFDAFAGEPTHDDEEGVLGQIDLEEDEDGVFDRLDLEEED